MTPFDSKKVLAIIGARSGSKGVANKNIRPLGGKPLMAWVIGAAKSSRYVDRVIVGTDSLEYADIAREWGAEVPYLQPPEVSHGGATDFEYVSYGLKWLREHEGYRPDVVVRLMPTVPLQQAADIDSSIEELVSHPDATSVVVLAEAHQIPHKALRITPEGRVVSYITGDHRGAEPRKRESYERAYFRANIVTTYPSVLQETGTIVGDHVRAHIIPQERAIDIDSETDFFIAEALLKKMYSSGTETEDQTV